MRNFLTFFFVIIPLLAAWGVAMTTAYPPELCYGSAIFAAAILLWFTESLPLPATALLIPALSILLGVSSAKEAFAPFGDEVIFLFIGVFLLAQAMQKHCWDKRMAYWLLASPFSGNSFFSLSLLLGAVTFLLTMWISNTAAAAMMCPIVLGVSHLLSENNALSEEEKRKINVRLLLLVAYSASIGGIVTPVGTPPNVITLSFLEKRGIAIDFLHWVSLALPIAVCAFSFLVFYLQAFLPVKSLSKETFISLRTEFTKRLSSLGPVTRAELQVAAVFSFAVFFWVLPGVLTSINPNSELVVFLNSRLPMSVVALAAGLILFFLPIKGAENTKNLTWDDAKHIDWGTVVLFGGGLSLGAMISKIGLGKILGETLFGATLASPFLLMAAAACATLLFTEVASNIAAATVLISILLNIIPEGSPLSSYTPVLASCFAASLGFMLPVGTPPNAIAYGTGEVPLRTMMKVGAFVDIVGVLLIIFFLRILGT